MDPHYSQNFRSTSTDERSNADLLSTSHAYSRYAAEFQLDLNDSDGPNYRGANAQYSGAFLPAASQNIISPMTERDGKEPALSLEQALDMSPHSAMWRGYLPRMPTELRTEMERKLRENPMRDEAFFQTSFDEFSRKVYGPREQIDRQNNLRQPQFRRQPEQQQLRAASQHHYYHDRVPQHNQSGMVPANQNSLPHRQAATHKQAMPANQQRVQARATYDQNSYYHHRSSEN
ncbi:hypothetical protein N7447_003324 [Penicillium robsamsonii]|uniref:uncharacterized protein n=1 Tax=Penicillium robsamsonii TaxID=1792511 RepID=UPI0025496E5C|nr:uncharacterized protein N7447_003324 [Penicillium robsamsonii]KAJ5826561.1 hypothetical protein N7447_003324 [Penicillium robsamsonii]